MGEAEGKRLVERSRYRLEDNIRMDFKERGWGLIDYIIWLRIVASGGLL
jgi:hypothetical protein